MFDDIDLWAGNLAESGVALQPIGVDKSKVHA
jgi:hypothetical protein